MSGVTTGGCRVCACTNATQWGEENGFQAVKCVNCSLVYISPWPDLEDRSRSLQYGAHQGERAINTNARPSGKSHIREYRKILNRLYGDTLTGQRVTWLDIGCGYGEFLTALQGTVAPDATLMGSEPNERKAQYARSRGLEVGYYDLDDLDQQFTHISLLNVFSHLPEPVEFLAKARDRLQPGGELLIQTGNAGDLERRDVPGELWLPDHLIFAGRQTLDLIMQQLGMHVLGSTTERHPRRTPANVAKDLIKRMIRPDYNPVNWRGPARLVWLRARKAT